MDSPGAASIPSSSQDQSQDMDSPGAGDAQKLDHLYKPLSVSENREIEALFEPTQLNTEPFTVTDINKQTGEYITIDINKRLRDIIHLKTFLPESDSMHEEICKEFLETSEKLYIHEFDEETEEDGRTSQTTIDTIGGFNRAIDDIINKYDQSFKPFYYYPIAEPLERTHGEALKSFLILAEQFHSSASQPAAGADQMPIDPQLLLKAVELGAISQLLAEYPGTLQFFTIVQQAAEYEVNLKQLLLKAATLVEQYPTTKQLLEEATGAIGAQQAAAEIVKRELDAEKAGQRGSVAQVAEVQQLVQQGVAALQQSAAGAAAAVDPMIMNAAVVTLTGFSHAAAYTTPYSGPESDAAKEAKDKLNNFNRLLREEEEEMDADEEEEEEGAGGRGGGKKKKQTKRKKKKNTKRKGKRSNIKKTKNKKKRVSNGQKKKKKKTKRGRKSKK